LYDAFSFDVVTGVVDLQMNQRPLMDIAVRVGMPRIQNPFTQVVLVTDTGKHPIPASLYIESDVTLAAKNVRVFDKQRLDPDLTEKQPEVDRQFYIYFATINQRREYDFTER
jgi:chemotaxis signal transduction protein